MHETHRIGAIISLLLVCVALGVSVLVTRTPKTSASDLQFVGVAPRGVGGETYSAVGASVITARPAPEAPVIVSVPTTTVDRKLEILSSQPEEIVESVLNEVSLSDSGVTRVTAPLLPPVKAEPIAIARTPITSEASFVEQLVIAIHTRTNTIRRKENLPMFSYDQTLEENAVGYSAVMQADGFLSHTNKSGCDMTCRFKADGYTAEAWGENLAHWQSSYTPTIDEVADYFVEKWVLSEGHRDNLLSPTFTQEGIGVSRKDNQIYVTVHFAKP
jgi:uncharacterized protein YkwD